ncbi:MAG: nicotinate-nucleotide diphosphorylase [Acidobacteria bacterium]|nr:nicotinate-nucleotide diphosphorylase [Acidobacteriota bacterium]
MKPSAGSDRRERLVEPLRLEEYQDIVRRAIAEDVGRGDLTSEATVRPGQQAIGTFVGKSGCVVAGLAVAQEVFTQLDPACKFDILIEDGAWCAPGNTIASVRGPARALLTAERTALNFLQRLCGIATLARRFSEAAAGRITVLDTRKTTPTLRALEKYAVRTGGARNHRLRLDAGILIKENHARLAGGIAAALARLREARPDIFRRASAHSTEFDPDRVERVKAEATTPAEATNQMAAASSPSFVASGFSRKEDSTYAGILIEVEAQSLAEVDEALTAGARRILIDNLSIDEIREAVRRTRGRAAVEISGGVTLDRMPALAATGAEYVSVGALTHSAPAADLSFEIEPF